jgi:hypothetical protein
MKRLLTQNRGNISKEKEKRGGEKIKNYRIGTRTDIFYEYV